MKNFLIIGMLCGCLLIGSFYPKLILDHHVRLVDQTGKEVEMKEDYYKWLPFEIRFRFLEFF